MTYGNAATVVSEGMGHQALPSTNANHVSRVSQWAGKVDFQSPRFLCWLCNSIWASAQHSGEKPDRITSGFQ